MSIYVLKSLYWEKSVIRSGLDKKETGRKNFRYEKKKMGDMLQSTYKSGTCFVLSSCFCDWYF